MMKKIHLICNAHIDPVWQWDRQEGVGAVLATFRSAVRLAETYDYIFCHNEVVVYKYVEEYDPELFEQIKSLVKRGKWHIMGGWYLQPDCNMPSGESFVRQIQTGKEYFMEKFGVFPTTAINFDPFGHTRGLVQIIKKCGQDSYMVCRPYDSELPLSSPQFLWEGLDGSVIKAFRAPEGYNTPLGGSVPVIERRARKQSEETACVLWGVGNHGGGPSAKDLKEIERLMQEKPNGEEYVHSTPEQFFAEIEPKQVVRDPLRISMPGCYTSMSGVKQAHIRLEKELYLAEIMLSLAYAKGLIEYPSARAKIATEDLLNGEFHDILPGSSIKAGEDDGLMFFHHGLLEADGLKTKAYFALCGEQEGARDGEYPVIVFNPHPYRLKENIECEFMLADQNWDQEKVAHIEVYDKTGKLLTAQTVKEKSNINLDWRKKIVFEGELEPLSLNRFSVYIHFAPQKAKRRSDAFVYQNAEKYVEIDRETGLLKSYKVGGKEYIRDGFSLTMFDDNPDPWGMSAFQQKGLGEHGRAFAPMTKPCGVFDGMKQIQVIEDGDIYLGIEAFFCAEHSSARVEYRIYKNTPDIDVRVNLFFNDINRMVKLAIPVCGAEEAVGQTAYGTERLFDDGRENVSQRFLAVKSGEKYLAIYNDCLYGSHFKEGKVYLSLVRGTSYCAHPILDREIIPSDRYVDKMEQGGHEFSFRISVADEQELERGATEFVRKPYALNVFPATQGKGSKAFGVELSNKNIVLSAMKKADEREGLILRLFNNYSKNAETKLTIGGVTCSIEFGKYEVKTVYFDGEIHFLPEMEI